ncbi:hypothetical protein ES705_38739 [subsurface metagenome]
MAKGPFMEFLRADVKQTVVDTYKEVQIPTPTSKTENMAMLIHEIYLEPNRLVDGTPTDTDTMELHLAGKTKATVTKVSDPDILAYLFAMTSKGTIWNWLETLGAQMWKFDPPILYPKANLFLAINTGGFTATMSAVCRIGYTLEKVSREDFISALVE